MALLNINENVYTQTFTPREYQVELLESAKKRNTIICSSTSSAKAFILVKLLQEFSSDMRKDPKKRALFILDPQNVPVMNSHISYLTDLKVFILDELSEQSPDILDILNQNQIILTTAELGFKSNIFQHLEGFNLLVIDNCLYGEKQKSARRIIREYEKLPKDNNLRIVGLTTGLLGLDLKPERLEAELVRLEKLLKCTVDTSSEIVSLIRLSCHPKEALIVSVKTDLFRDLKQELVAIITQCRQFLEAHRFDPSEIYPKEFLEDYKKIPNPKHAPLELLDTYLEILNDLGPYGADKAAQFLLSKIEKLKVKTPWERHYLLLCMVSTTLIKTRATCDYWFFQTGDDMDVLVEYSTPKVNQLIHVLRQFKPPGEQPRRSEVERPPEENVQYRRTKGKTTRRYHRVHTDDFLCCLMLVHNRYKAKALFAILCTLSQHDNDLWWISALYSVEKTADPITEPKEAENEHKVQEEVLRKFRCHECNILVSTPMLESGCDLPKCNLVIRFDLSQTFHSYIQSKSKARAADAYYISFVNEAEKEEYIDRLAEYNEVENTLLKRCSSLEPSKQEQMLADQYSKCCPIYQPLKEDNAPSVTLFNSIALINKYCVKLPSDTFTRLTPIWYEEKVENGFVCHIRLPINSPVKRTIRSPPMPNALLSRRAAAFILCQLLHKMGELDDQLQPINKENFVPLEVEWCNFPLDESFDENSEARPGTTKRRQHYYKKIADSITDCHPVPDEPTYFYEIQMKLTCPLPEEQNTRGRRIYPPEDSPQGFGILTSREIPQISAFPIFTRSGEVSVELVLRSSQVIVTEERLYKIEQFVNYTFTSVLRLQKCLTLFNPEAASMNYLIVPTITKDEGVEVDWSFLDLIYENLNFLPVLIPDEDRQDYTFDAEEYQDAVVMPWYRNQDQPQYFYVAEICPFLNPTSAFPGLCYKSFQEYYLKKYNIQIQNLEQYLLDVDHTSARLNFLTPRYVNRKGVALPTSSEETKRAKRENLEQKQILVPELCAIHPFPASLWRKAVALPCILYRVNALLLADQIRNQVAKDLDLGKPKLEKDFKWPALNFGWNLSDVLRKSREEEKRKQEEKLQLLHQKAEENFDDLPIDKLQIEEVTEDLAEDGDDEMSVGNDDSKDDQLEIGTWSNDMAAGTEGSAMVRYSSPTSWYPGYVDDSSDSDLTRSDIDSDESENEWGKLRIEFKGVRLAEAVEDNETVSELPDMVNAKNVWELAATDESYETGKLVRNFKKACRANKQNILESGMLVENAEFNKKTDVSPSVEETDLEDALSFDFNQLILQEVPAPPPSFVVNFVHDTSYDYPEELNFSFDEQPDLTNHPGPSPNVLLQALTMSNANDGINLERLETIGDSFLKYAITSYLYTKYENVHEGKLSHLRSKQVSNLNLYRLGRNKNLGEYMIATKFDPQVNWLPPCFFFPDNENALPPAFEDILNTPPYNLVTQHSIPDKSIADCVEALIGAYLIECGPRGALLFMAWLGIKVLPFDNTIAVFGELEIPRSPLLSNVPNPQEELERLLDGYEAFERHIGYKFNDRAYLLQAFTHASYSPNQLTDCYQRLEFLGDAVLDYLITRHLYEDPRMHSPGALTDLRSALVNNTIFASLAVRNGFHKYFKHLSPGLNDVVERFIRLQEESGHNLMDELYLVVETEHEEVEDVEVPKALGDVFESVAGAIFLDSKMSLDAVWKVYHRMMKQEIEQFSNKVPKSPIRELLELEPETAKFGRPEKLADGRKVRVTVQVFGKGVFKGIGRNYRIAKCTAAKCALKHLKRKCLLRTHVN